MRKNPGGFVLNSFTTPTRSYLKLHKLGASRLDKPNPLRLYSKFCGSRAEIKDHLHRVFGLTHADIHDCGNCWHT